MTHWTHGASNIRIATDDRDRPIHTCLPRVTIIDDDAWTNSPLRRRRQDQGLLDFVRATAPVTRGVALIVHLDGLTPQWRASATELTLLSGVTAAMADAFADRFIAPALRRQALLDDLTAAQRVVAPLLASGLSERAIGRKLDRNCHTIHEHAKRIYACWDVPSRYALRDKWLGADTLPGYEPPLRSLPTPVPVA